MKFSIERRAFLDQVNTATRAISAHPVKPILSGVYIQTQKGTGQDKDMLILVGSESQLAIRCLVHPDERNHLYVEQEGSIVVEARYLVEILRKMSGSRVYLELVDENLLQIQDNEGTFKFRVLKSSDYPMPDFLKPATSFYLEGNILRDIVRQVGFAASEKDLRPVLLGVHFMARDGLLTVAATDSYRLAKKIIYLKHLPDFEITVPVKALSEVVKAMNGDEAIFIHCDPRKIQFYFGDCLFQSALYEGAYPDIERIIPHDFNSSLYVDASRFSRTLELSMIYLSEKVSVVRLECEPSKSGNVNQAVLYASSKEVGSSDQYLSDIEYEGSPISISFNGMFMQQALRGLDCDGRVRLQFIGPLKPIRITNPENDSLEMIVVPLRTH